MGGVWSSTTTDSNSYSSNSTTPTDSPKPDASNPNMTSSSDSTTPESQAPKDPLDPQMVTKTLEKENQEDVGESENVLKEDEEEEGECGFCLFMKAGGCRESFIAWEECVQKCEENKEDLVEKCFEVTASLKKCMKAHPDYYYPILKAEEAAEDEVVRELEKEKASKSSELDATSENPDQHGDSSYKQDG